jgi:hypothetical protein
LIVPLWVRLVALGGILLLLAGVLKSCRDDLIDQGVHEERAVWQERERKRLIAEDNERDRLDKLKEQSDHETRQAIAAANADRDRAAAVAGQLRSRLAALAPQGAGSAPVGQRAAAADPIGVLADVLSRADERAGVLAAHADAARIAGAQCERDYDALRPAP